MADLYTDSYTAKYPSRKRRRGDAYTDAYTENYPLAPLNASATTATQQSKDAGRG